MDKTKAACQDPRTRDGVKGESAGGWRAPREPALDRSETGSGDAACDGHLQLQQHGWGFRDGRKEWLEGIARERKRGNSNGLLRLHGSDR